MYIHTKKGFVTTEAAIVIPLVIIAVLTVGSVMKIAYYEERVSFIVGNELSELSKNAYIENSNPFFAEKLIKITKRKIPELESPYIEKYKYKFEDNRENTDNLIIVEISFGIETGLPGNMVRGLRVKEAYLIRAFCGKDNALTADIKNEFQTDYDYEPVYLLPEYGVKYHTRTCRYVNSYPLQSLMTDSIKRKYKSCNLCQSKKAAEGSIIYCFQYGNSYHTAVCSTVTKYTVCMDRHDAEIRGYTKCSICGGR